MGKFTYRATEFKRVDWEKLIGQGQGDLVVSIDVAKRDFFATLMRRDRTVLGTVKWVHPQESGAVVEALMSRLGGQAVEVAMEPTGTYGDAVRQLWRQAGAAIYRVSPKRVHDAAELYDGVPSLHDAKAAYLIGRLHLDGASALWVEKSPAQRQSQGTLGLLEFYQERKQRALNRLEALMARHWPEAGLYLALESTSLLKLLKAYGCPAEVAADSEAAAAQLRRDGRGWLQGEKIESLLGSAKQSVGVGCVPSERLLLQELAGEVLEVGQHIGAIEKTLKSSVQASPGLAAMAAAVGATTATVLHSALGEAGAYPRADSYVKAAGLNLKERSSGKHKGQLKLTKRGPSSCRHYLYFAALRLLASDPHTRRWYQAKVARDGGLKGKAIGALMRKLLKALWRVGQGEEFDPARMFATPSPALGA